MDYTVGVMSIESIVAEPVAKAEPPSTTESGKEWMGKLSEEAIALRLRSEGAPNPIYQSRHTSIVTYKDKLDWNDRAVVGDISLGSNDKVSVYSRLRIRLELVKTYNELRQRLSRIPTTTSSNTLIEAQNIRSVMNSIYHCTTHIIPSSQFNILCADFELSQPQSLELHETVELNRRLLNYLQKDFDTTVFIKDRIERADEGIHNLEPKIADTSAIQTATEASSFVPATNEKNPSYLIRTARAALAVAISLLISSPNDTAPLLITTHSEPKSTPEHVAEKDGDNYEAQTSTLELSPGTQEIPLTEFSYYDPDSALYCANYPEMLGPGDVPQGGGVIARSIVTVPKLDILISQQNRTGERLIRTTTFHNQGDTEVTIQLPSINTITSTDSPYIDINLPTSSQVTHGLDTILDSNVINGPGAVASAMTMLGYSTNGIDPQVTLQPGDIHVLSFDHRPNEEMMTTGTTSFRTADGSPPRVSISTGYHRHSDDPYIIAFTTNIVDPASDSTEYVQGKTLGRFNGLSQNKLNAFIPPLTAPTQYSTLDIPITDEALNPSIIGENPSLELYKLRQSNTAIHAGGYGVDRTIEFSQIANPHSYPVLVRIGYITGGQTTDAQGIGMRQLFEIQTTHQKSLASSSKIYSFLQQRPGYQSLLNTNDGGDNTLYEYTLQPGDSISLKLNWRQSANNIAPGMVSVSFEPIF